MKRRFSELEEENIRIQFNKKRKIVHNELNIKEILFNHEKKITLILNKLTSIEDRLSKLENKMVNDKPIIFTKPASYII